MMMTALHHTLTPSKTKIRKLKERTIKMNEEKLKEWMKKMKEWNQKMKKCTMNFYLLLENDISYNIPPPSTIIMVHPISATWDGATWLLDPMPSTMMQRPMPKY